MNPMNPRLIHSKETSYFIISLLFSIMVYFGLIVSLIGIFYLAIGLGITFFLRGLMIGHIRSNGVKLTEHQFPAVHRKVRELCAQMDIRQVPDVFVLQSDGMLNAFASRFFGRNFIVLYSNLFEMADTEEDELTYVIAHELAHIKRNHMTKSLLLLPAQWMPFLGKAYSRACEYTCDRMAAAYTGNVPAAVSALSILAIGRTMYAKVNVAEYIAESRKETGFFVWFSYALSTHPPLPKRIEQMELMKAQPQLFGYASPAFEREPFAS
ncbi:M48 family metallopeptidase [Paenibacillus elgii]|uniref:M48 family metallopeptidase n=1 Tax=Paenibacillus elgii TaxID=189691 RepID=UPI00203A92CE|nr:M48 family metallopeptidase [Paenibacillus elgii]MCM3269972.1 M48 family metallopeptidase [Paenibacillus elgii]